MKQTNRTTFTSLRARRVASLFLLFWVRLQHDIKINALLRRDLFGFLFYSVRQTKFVFVLFCFLVFHYRIRHRRRAPCAGAPIGASPTHAAAEGGLRRLRRCRRQQPACVVLPWTSHAPGSPAGRAPQTHLFFPMWDPFCVYNKRPQKRLCAVCTCKCARTYSLMFNRNTSILLYAY